MFKPVKATSIKEYMNALPPERKEPIAFLDAFIKKTAPTLKAHFAANMLGYGTFPYKNGEWHTIGLASQKNYISLYICCVQNGKYLAEKYKEELGNVSVGKSCISFKKLEDLNLDTLKKIITLAEKNPGFEGMGKKEK